MYVTEWTEKPPASKRVPSAEIMNLKLDLLELGKKPANLKCLQITPQMIQKEIMRKLQ